MFSYAVKLIKSNHPQKIAFKGALIFFLFSLLWILFSDSAAAYFFTDTESLTDIQSVKGIVYISITSILVYVLIDSLERTVEKMGLLKKLGIRFSMDDFGTGYSSLSYLRRLPFDELKIDRSFVMDISKDGSGKAIAESIISITKNLAKDVVAEGVELSEEVDFLFAHGCCNYQGFLFAKPMPSEAFDQAMRVQIK